MIFQVICEEATEKAVEFKVFRSLLLNLNGSDPLSTVVHLSFSMKAFVQRMFFHCGTFSSFQKEANDLAELLCIIQSECKTTKVVGNFQFLQAALDYDNNIEMVIDALALMYYLLYPPANSPVSPLASNPSLNDISRHIDWFYAQPPLLHHPG